MRNAIIFVVLTGAFVGWIAPDLPGVGENPIAPETKVIDTVPAADTASAATDDRGWTIGALSLDREADGHFYADVNVRQRPYRMLVDTGASVVALTGHDARDMGLHWDPTQVGVIGQGASGDVHGVAVTIPELQLGEFTATNVPAVIVPEGLHISLLGQDFLRRIGSVRIEGDRMVLDR